MRAWFEGCNKTEANVEDGSARFLTQNDTVFFKDGEYETIEWQYAPLADGKDVC